MPFDPAPTTDTLRETAQFRLSSNGKTSPFYGTICHIEHRQDRTAYYQLNARNSHGAEDIIVSDMLEMDPAAFDRTCDQLCAVAA